MFSICRMCIVPFTSDLFIHLNLKCVFRRRDSIGSCLYVQPEALCDSWVCFIHLHVMLFLTQSDLHVPSNLFFSLPPPFSVPLCPPYCYLLHYMRTLQCTILTPLRIFSLYRFELFSGQLLEGPISILTSQGLPPMYTNVLPGRLGNIRLCDL